MYEPQLLLVDEHDQPRGTMGKLQAHQQGELHRCFSILVYDADGNWLLQRRAAGKYHCGGLWTNTCCSHPTPEETTASAAQRRLAEEMGISTPLAPLFSFLYKAEFENGLTEHEYDHVLVGEFNEDRDGPIAPNPNEADAYEWVHPKELQRRIAADPEAYTVWFRLMVPALLERLEAAPVSDPVPHLGYLPLG